MKLALRVVRDGPKMMEKHIALKDSPQRWWLMALLVSGMIICYAHRGTLSIAGPFMIREMHLPPAVLGVLQSAFFWSYSFMQVPAGTAVDRFGVRRAYALGYVVWIAASALTGFAQTRWALMLARMGLGVGQSVAFPASARAVANWFQDRERGAVTAGYLTGVRLGAALINFVGAFLLAAYGLKFFFVVTGLIPLLWLLPWLRFLGKWEDQRPPVAADRPAPLPDKRLSLLESLALLRNPNVFGIFLGFFAYDYAWFVYVNWLPGYLSLGRHFSTREVGFYSSMPFIAMSVVILLSGFLSDALVRRGYSEISVRKACVMVGLAIACLIVPAGLVADKMVSVWLLTLSLCGLGLSAPNTWTLTQAVCSKNIVGTVSGIQNFGGNLGGAIAPALIGYTVHRTGSFELAFHITGGILVVGILAYGLLITRRVGVEA